MLNVYCVRVVASERFSSEKCGKIWKIGRFFGGIWPDWRNATQADVARLGSIDRVCLIKPVHVYIFGIVSHL